MLWCPVCCLVPLPAALSTAIAFYLVYSHCLLTGLLPCLQPLPSVSSSVIARIQCVFLVFRRLQLSAELDGSSCLLLIRDSDPFADIVDDNAHVLLQLPDVRNIDGGHLTNINLLYKGKVIRAADTPFSLGMSCGDKVAHNA